MCSSRPSSKGLFGVVALACGLLLTACEDDPEPQKVVPHAGIVDPADLPAGASPKLVSEDREVLYGCTANQTTRLNDQANSRYFVEYTVDGQTEVRSYLYTYTNDHELDTNWQTLADGNQKCVKLMTTDPNGRYELLTGLPPNATGYRTTWTSDTQITVSEQVWSRRGNDSIVSVAVIKSADKTAGPPQLPLSTKTLTEKAAAS